MYKKNYFLVILTIIFGLLTIFCFSIEYWISKTFDNPYLMDVIWQIQTADFECIKGIDRHYIRHGAKVALAVILLGCFWIYINIYWSKLYKKIKKYTPSISFQRRVSFTLLFTSFISLISFIIYFCIKYDMSVNNLTYDETLYKENYYIPNDSTIKFKNKKNLIVVMVESWESSFGKDNNKTSYIPNSEKLQTKNSVYSEHMHQVYGLTHTIAAMTGWHFGLPLHYPVRHMGNKYITKDGFLPHATSIFDILEQHGYQNFLIMGSDSHFSGTNLLFSGHGKFTILDKNTFESQGWQLEQYQGTGWGFSDKFIFSRAEEQLDKLIQQDQPFVLFIQTIDTHAPEGFCPTDKQIYHDIRDAIIQTDKHIYDFAQYVMKKCNHENTVLAIMGDHRLMRKHDFIEKDQDTTRIYNYFYGALPQKEKEVKNSYISALDIAPTLLQCAGATWDNYHFGLGFSIFAKEPSLLEKYGKEKINNLLSIPSKKYESFY